MILEGKFKLKAPIQKLWDTILQPETLKACLPGAEKIELIDERTYDCVVKQKVGPISVREDQEIAGLIMQLGGGAVFWTAIGTLFLRWYRAEGRPARGER